MRTRQGWSNIIYLISFFFKKNFLSSNLAICNANNHTNYSCFIFCIICPYKRFISKNYLQIHTKNWLP